MSITDLDFYKGKLEKERLLLEKELEKVGRRNPENTDDWEPINPDLNIQWSDPNEASDQFEEFETQVGIETALEEKLDLVREALVKIEKGEYGKCGKCSASINPKRLEAEPSARFCAGCAQGKN